MTLKSKKSKSFSAFIKEFFVHNIDDLMTGIPVLPLVGLVFKPTFGVSSKFILMQYGENVTTPAGIVTRYTTGWYDLLTVLYYMFVVIAIHLQIKELVIDRLIRKLHLSKTKNSKFIQCGQLFWFHLFSFAWTVFIMFIEAYFAKLSDFWELYPFTTNSASTKFFFITQIAYWIHIFPLQYILKLKKDHFAGKLSDACVNLVFLLVAYLLNFGRIAVLILSLHHLCEVVYHFIRLAYFAEKSSISKLGFRFMNVFYPASRLVIISFAVVVGLFGLGKSSLPEIDYQSGNFNTKFIRINCLLLVIASQLLLIYSYASAHLRRLRARQQLQAQRKTTAAQRRIEKAQLALKGSVASESADDSGADMTEANDSAAVVPQQHANGQSASVAKRAVASQNKKK